MAIVKSLSLSSSFPLSVCEEASDVQLTRKLTSDLLLVKFAEGLFWTLTAQGLMVCCVVVIVDASNRRGETITMRDLPSADPFSLISFGEF
jgi:hypothetical protein